MASCASLPENFNKYEQGSWAAKALIQDHKTNNSYIVNMDIHAIKNKALRMDVSTSLAISIASLSYVEEEMQILLNQEKKFYSGKATAKAIRKLIPIEMKPQWLNAVLFDQAIEEKSWVCTRDKNAQLDSCKGPGLEIRWLKRQRQMRVLSLESKYAQIQLQLKGFEAQSMNLNQYKIPAPPKAFKIYKL